MTICFLCYNSTWVKCFLKSSDKKCESCTVCNNKQYIRCYICNLGKYLNTIDNNKPYDSLFYEMFYYDIK
jgi:hypothetical protein